MLIVLDETIGFSSSPFLAGHDTPYVIKPAKTKKQNQTFDEYIHTQSSAVLPKTLRLGSYSMESEIEFFSNIFQRYATAGPMIYFYDPAYTDHPVIRRVQNVFQPDKKLYPLPAALNRAETLFIINRLADMKDWFSTNGLTYQELRQRIKSWTAGASGWVLTPNTKSIFKKRTLHKVYRKKKWDAYTQVRIHDSGKLESRKKDTLHAIWEDVKGEAVQRDAWVVTKGTELSSADVPTYALKDEAFPINIPYVQVFEPAVRHQST
ncbi:hypothetical protein SAMN05192534_110111 [Alteribacillus persepolensis]|uniref:Uncharacterized protein n=1 Tax=Alteribacillus persepolensis TaxID=568899 RepID=A0A1G8EXK9_9BACI|nr:hypothetical protein [Alteribacillus persepolensis]SDH74636.1 hypothetical protein SAMN05192534_110111 [Alteribacillus persepolensis]